MSVSHPSGVSGYSTPADPVFAAKVAKAQTEYALDDEILARHARAGQLEEAARLRLNQARDDAESVVRDAQAEAKRILADANDRRSAIIAEAMQLRASLENHHAE